MSVGYIALKDVCKINMGQSPDSASYNDSGEGIPFFQGNIDFGERYPAYTWTKRIQALKCLLQQLMELLQCKTSKRTPFFF